MADLAVSTEVGFKRDRRSLRKWPRTLSTWSELLRAVTLNSLSSTALFPPLYGLCITLSIAVKLELFGYLYTSNSTAALFGPLSFAGEDACAGNTCGSGASSSLWTCAQLAMSADNRELFSFPFRLPWRPRHSLHSVRHHPPIPLGLYIMFPLLQRFSAHASPPFISSVSSTSPSVLQYSGEAELVDYK